MVCDIQNMGDNYHLFYYWMSLSITFVSQHIPDSCPKSQRLVYGAHKFNESVPCTENRWPTVVSWIIQDCILKHISVATLIIRQISAHSKSAGSEKECTVAGNKLHLIYCTGDYCLTHSIGWNWWFGWSSSLKLNLIVSDHAQKIRGGMMCYKFIHFRILTFTWSTSLRSRLKLHTPNCAQAVKRNMCTQCFGVNKMSHHKKTVFLSPWSDSIFKWTLT